MAGAVVQSKAAENAAAGTTLASGNLASNVVSGNRLWVVVNCGDNQTITLSQNGGTATIGTITSLGSVQEAGVLDKYEHFDIPITGGGTLDILATFGASTDRRTIVVHEISVVTGVDGSDEQTDTGSNPTPTLTVNVTVQPAFGLAMNIDYQGGTPTVGSGWTDGGTFTTTTAAQRLQTKAITSTGNTTGNFGNAGLDRNNAVMIVYTEQSTPQITNQPDPVTVEEGQTAVFSITATGATSYQWQVDTGSGYANVSGGSGATTDTYTTPALAGADNGNLYRCVATNANGSTNSDGALLTVTIMLLMAEADGTLYADENGFMFATPTPAP